MKYSDYSVNDFVMDEHFQKWVLQPDPDVNAFWETWITQNPDKTKLIDSAREIVQLINFNRYELPKADSLSVWEHIIFGIEAHENYKKEKKLAETIPQIQRFRYWHKIAAVFAGIMFINSAWFLFYGSNKMTEYATDYGQTKTIILPDSSTVILNANSSLKYHSSWDQENQKISSKTPFSEVHREVWLDGEAYFNVVKTTDSEKDNLKFVVHTPNIEVEVLGTSFNVNNRRDKTKVFLNSGKVKLNPALGSAFKNGAIMMEPGDMIEISDGNRHFTRSKESPAINSSWINNKLIFDEISIREVALILEDNYGIDVVFENIQVADKKIKGTFPADNIEVLFSTLSLSFDVKISRKKNRITFL